MTSYLNFEEAYQKKLNENNLKNKYFGIVYYCTWVYNIK